MTQPVNILAASVNEGCAENLHLSPDPENLTRLLGVGRAIPPPQREDIVRELLRVIGFVVVGVVIVAGLLAVSYANVTEFTDSQTGITYQVTR